MKTKDFLGNGWDITCMGCAVSDGSMRVPGGIIQKTKYFCVHQDPLIPIEGFLVIASTRHIQSIFEMENAEYEDFSKLLWNAHHAIKEVTKIERLTVIQEEGSHHFHLWFFPWTKKVIEQYGDPSLSKIRGIMADFRTRSITKQEWGKLKESIQKIKVEMESF